MKKIESFCALDDSQMFARRSRTEIPCLHSQCAVYPPCLSQPTHPQVLLSARQLWDHRLFFRRHHSKLKPQNQSQNRVSQMCCLSVSSQWKSTLIQNNMFAQQKYVLIRATLLREMSIWPQLFLYQDQCHYIMSSKMLPCHSFCCSPIRIKCQHKLYMCELTFFLTPLISMCWSQRSQSSTLRDWINRANSTEHMMGPPTCLELSALITSRPMTTPT